ncbi:MocR-like pyridoxine biosynthesis transcription factor PdxR [Abyssibius alkaniclasticus]|uniref:MocR-like pyridoxine biosynthesis transcription factor PdxR n=1 Tax=Abyssibius alkaniclasticus TaxID=2881234 RepID=UPI004058A012
MAKTTQGALLSTILVDRGTDIPIPVQIATEIREMILSRVLAAGQRLPSSRALAHDMGVARSSVVQAMETLVFEGFVTSRTGDGSYVSSDIKLLQDRGPQRRKPEAGKGQNTPLPRLSARGRDIMALAYEMRPNLVRAFTTAVPALDAFPTRLWSRLTSRFLRNSDTAHMVYGPAEGHAPLRAAIAQHLRLGRGLNADPGRIFIVNGAQMAVQLCAMVLADPGDMAVFEDPGGIGPRNALKSQGLCTIPVPIDAEGLDVARARAAAPDARLVLVTPSHQHPTSVIMSLRRRLELLAYAKAAGAWILEDDYDGELRYSGVLQPSLASIDADGSVIYIGSFAKTLFPSLRLGFVVVPDALVDVFRLTMSACIQGLPVLPQAVVAAFISEGHYAAHIRNMRQLYAHRAALLLDHGARQLAGKIDLRPVTTGFHTVGRLDSLLDPNALERRLAERQVRLVSVNRYRAMPASDNRMILGFSCCNETMIANGMQSIANTIEAMEAERKGRSHRA